VSKLLSFDKDTVLVKFFNMIKVEHLYKSFKLDSKRQKMLGTKEKELSALSDISFRAEAGKVLLLLGTKNAGKSTLLHILGAAAEPDSGTVHVLGMNVATQQAEIRRQVGYLSSGQPFFNYLSVTEQLEYAARIGGLAPANLRGSLPALLEKWQLAAIAKRKIATLSETERLHLGIAQAMVHQPRLLLLDEPTLGLDVFTAQPIIDLVNDAKNNGIGVVFATNSLSKAELLGDELLILHKGKLLHQSFMLDFKQQDTTSSAAEFLRIIVESKE